MAHPLFRGSFRNAAVLRRAYRLAIGQPRRSAAQPALRQRMTRVAMTFGQPDSAVRRGLVRMNKCAAPPWEERSDRFRHRRTDNWPSVANEHGQDCFGQKVGTILCRHWRSRFSPGLCPGVALTPRRSPDPRAEPGAEELHALARMRLIRQQKKSRAPGIPEPD